MKHDTKTVGLLLIFGTILSAWAIFDRMRHTFTVVLGHFGITMWLVGFFWAAVLELQRRRDD